MGMLLKSIIKYLRYMYIYAKTVVPAATATAAAFTVVESSHNPHNISHSMPHASLSLHFPLNYQNSPLI